MFFDIILLNSQHGGRFGIAWVAATRGVRFVTKKQIKELNLLKLCDELKLFIISYSTSPKKRFSLRLSVTLVNGMLKIFREQATILQGEIISLISTVHIPTGIGYAAADLTETGIFETPPTPIAKIKTKRARKVITETPEILQDRTDQMFLQLSNVEDILQQPAARADEISIREEMPKQTEPIEDDFSLGVRSRKEIEEDMQMLFTKTKDIPIVHPQYPSSDSQPFQNLIEVVAQVHAPKDGFIEDLQALQQPRTDENFSATVPFPRIDLESERLTEHISEVESASVLQPLPTEGLSLGKEVHPSTELLEVVQTADIPPAVEIEVDLPREAAKMSKKTKRERKQLAELQVDEVALRSQQIAQKRGKFKVKHAGKRIVGINRCNENNGQLTNDSYQLLPLPYKVDLCDSSYNLFWTDEVAENIQMRRVSSVKTLSVRESADLRRTATSSLQPSTLESISDVGLRKSVQPIETPEQRLILQEAIRQTGDMVKQISIEEPIVPASTPRKRKRTDDEEFMQIPLEDRAVGAPEEVTCPDQITIAEHIAVANHAAAPEAIISREVESIVQELSEQIPSVRTEMKSPLPSDYKMRQQRIIDIVAKWTQGPLTIEHICEKPIHRLHIARAFSDLLILAANRFLILKSDEDSLELKYIGKGPKLVNR